MTVWLYARFDCYRLGAHSMTVTESSGGTALIALPAAATARFYHGDSTDNTGDGRLPSDGGTINLGAYLQSLLNSAGLANTYTVTWAPTTGLYTIARATGTATFSLTFSTLSAAGERMRRVIGFSADQSTATTHTSTQSCWYWYAFDGAASADTGRQCRRETKRANVAVSGGRQVFKVKPYTRAYGRKWTQQFQSHADAFDSDDTTGGDVWTLERLFEHLIDERFLWFPSTTTVFAYRNRQGVYELSDEGIEGWEIRRVIPNSDLFWDVTFDVIEWDTNDPEGSDPTLFSWTDLTFTRSTVATYQTSATTIADAAINALRYEDRGDGYGPLPLFEGASTNYVTRSESMYLGTGWTLQNCTGLLNVISPDGTVNGSRLTSDGAGDYSRVYITSTHAGSVPQTCSVWIRDGAQNTGAHAHLFGLSDGTYNSDTAPYNLAWTRQDMTVASIVANSAPFFHIDPALAAPGAASGDDIVLFGAQSEQLRFPSSYIRATAGSTVTRGADTGTLAAGSVPTTMKSGVWQLAVLPIFGSSDMVSGDIRVFVSFDDANNSLRIRHNGTDVKIEAYQASTVRAASLAITFSRHQRLLVTVNAAAGTVTVTGASTGNGAGATGTVWTWACATGIRVGGNYGATGEAFCRFELPRVA